MEIQNLKEKFGVYMYHNLSLIFSSRLNEITEEDKESVRNIGEYIFNIEKISVIDKLYLFFQVYEDIPSYQLISLITFHLNISILDNQTKLFLWNKFYNYLSYSDTVHSEPIEYSLWCDFFEDPKIVNEVWDNLIKNKNNLNDKFLERILPILGAVPFELKSELYSKLISENKWHLSIFISLLQSKFEYYGQINNLEAKKILEQLDLNLNNDLNLKENYKKLIDSL